MKINLCFRTSRSFFIASLLSGFAWNTAPAVTPTFNHIIVASDPGGEPLEKAIADIDGDGQGDLIVGMGTTYGPGGIYWWQCPAGGPANGTWAKHTIIASGNCYEHSQIYDLNGDGRPDLICSYNSNVVWFKHPGGNGTALWGNPNQIAAGIGHDIRLVDMDGDGLADVVTDRTRNINFQTGSPSNITWQTVGWGSNASGTAFDGLALLDIGTGNGAIDIVGVTTAGIYWFENPRETGGNARTGTWLAHFIMTTDTGGPSLAAMDVNGDGRMDIIQCPNEGRAQYPATDGLVWYEAPADRRNGTWIKHIVDTTWQDVHWMDTVDMNNDGHLDLVLTEQESSHDPVPNGPFNYNNDKVGIFYGTGTGFSAAQVLATTGGQNQAVSDIEGDGDNDFFYANHGVYGAPHPIELWLNNLITNTKHVRRFETEVLAVAASSGDSHRILDALKFSNTSGTILDANGAGDYVTYALPNVAAGSYDVKVGIKKFTSRGTWQLGASRLDDLGHPFNVGSPVDEYATSEIYTEVDLGTWTPTSTSDKAFKFTVTGKNASSSGYGISFDYVKLIPQ